VLDQLATGATNAAIAGILHLSERTVAHHISAILTKLGAPNRLSAINGPAAGGCSRNMGRSTSQNRQHDRCAASRQLRRCCHSYQEAAMSNSPETVISAYFDALNRSDAQRLASLFDEDGAFMGNEAPTSNGCEQIRAMAEAAFNACSVKHQFSVDSVAERDGHAVVQTHSAGTLTVLGAGTTNENAHRELFVLRNRGDRWLITHYMYNSAERGGGSA
jgi:uncharacterized protein (TIGR02246 family)